MTTLALAGPDGAFLGEGDVVELEGLSLVTGSPGGSRVMGASAEHVLVLDAITGEVLVDEEMDGGNIHHASLIDDGHYALAWQGGVTVHRPDGREILRVGGYTGRVDDLALAPDGTQVAVATPDGVFVHAVPGGATVWSSEAGRHSVAFHPTAPHLYAGVEDGNVVLARDGGDEVGRFGVAPVDRFAWAGDELWTRSRNDAPRPHAPEDHAPRDPVDAPISAAWAVDGSQHLVVDSCLLDPAAGNRWCTGSDTVGAALATDGSVWLGTSDGLEHWTEMPDDGATPAGGGGGAAVAVGVGPDGHVIEAGADGLVTVRGPDGAPLWGAQPDCAADPCVPMSLGISGSEAWWVSPDGVAWAWEIATGTPADKSPRATKGTAAGRTDDGTWVVRAKDKARVGPKPGKGGGPALAGRGIVVGGAGFATLDEVGWWAADGTPHTPPRLGPGREARHVVLAPDDSSLVLVDDQGAVHRYTPDGRAVYRRPAAFGDIVDLVVLTDGTVVLAEPSALRVLDPETGADEMRLVLAGDGPVALAGRESAVVAWSRGGATAVWRIDPDDLRPEWQPDPDAEPVPDEDVIVPDEATEETPAPE